MKKTFIWDLDGTLLDSYHVIVAGICAALAENGVFIDPEEVYRRAIKTSVGALLNELHLEHDYCLEKVSARNREISHSRVLDITLMPGAKEILETLREKGHLCMVYTHKGGTTEKNP